MPGLAQDNLRILQEVHTSLKLFCNTDFGYNKFTNEQILWNVVFWSNQKRKFTSEIQKYSHFLYKEVNWIEFFDMFDYTRRMGLTTDIFSFLFKVESQLKYHDLELDEKLQSSERFQFLWWNRLIHQNET